MTDTGIVRRVDMLGRVVIPKEIRNTFKIGFGDPMEIYTANGEIVLKKYSPIPNLHKVSEQVAESLNKMTEHSVLICDKSEYIAAVGDDVENAASKAISSEVENVLAENKTKLSNFSDGTGTVSLYEGANIFHNQLFAPVTVGGETVGLIILCNTEKDKPITSSDVRLATLGAEFISANS